LGIDQLASEKEDEPKVVNAATILVTPKQAQKITLAQKVGEVTLTLRNEADVDTFKSEVIKLVDLQTPEPEDSRPVRRVIVRPKRPAAPPKPTRTTVEVIRGLEVEKENVKIDEEEASGGQQQ
ncbi:MAG TPA: RcpC/CpaB family pilus assembly protein, partial [Gammaproteobacteria bacterium]|nr:RcpC/CpaB family pilus assembly protein [Gammaproteobacteria bacterium]